MVKPALTTSTGPPRLTTSGSLAITARQLLRHVHTFSTPINVLRLDINALDNGDFANFAWTDTNGNTVGINLNPWIANGDAVVTLGAGHSIQALPVNPSLIGVRDSNGVAGAAGGATTIEFTFPTPAAQFFAGKNSVSGQSIRDAYAYKLFYDDHLSVVCFAKGTMIEAKSGMVAIEDLRAGDLVRTRDNDFQPFGWIGSRKLRTQELSMHQNLRPIRIDAGALGPNTPSSDLSVSPQHRVLVRSKIARQLFDSDEVLVAAKHLQGLPGVDVDEEVSEVEYFQVLFDRHEIIFANGAEAESVFTAPTH